ncbi:MAG: hypothetical protein ACAH10_10150, partial [Methylophilaceae bacterium]
KTEEGLLDKLGYPTLITHIDCQKQFEKMVDTATNEAMIEKDPQILLKFLRDWWVNHLTKEHPEYADCFNKLKDTD